MRTRRNPTFLDQYIAFWENPTMASFLSAMRDISPAHHPLMRRRYVDFLMAKREAMMDRKKR